MAKLSVQEIKNRAQEIIAQNPGGIRYSILVNRISTDNPETPKNTVAGAVWNLEEVFPTEITKPSRGLFKPINIGGADQGILLGETEQVAPTGLKV